MFRGELDLFRILEARVSRSIGKFDTTASGPKRQVAFWVMAVARMGTGVEDAAEIAPEMPKRHSPVEWRLGTCIWSLASRTSGPVGLFHRCFCSGPAGLRSVAVALAGLCVLCG